MPTVLRGWMKRGAQTTERDRVGKDQSGPLGNRTSQPHSDKGWFPSREKDGNTDKVPRGGKPGSGEHDRPQK